MITTNEAKAGAESSAVRKTVSLQPEIAKIGMELAAMDGRSFSNFVGALIRKQAAGKLVIADGDREEVAR